MTPKEIIEIFESKLTEDSKRQAIEAINQYAREMCDKQKELCAAELGNETGSYKHEGLIENAPYPKELIKE